MPRKKIRPCVYSEAFRQWNLHLGDRHACRICYQEVGKDMRQHVLRYHAALPIEVYFIKVSHRSDEIPSQSQNGCFSSFSSSMIRPPRRRHRLRRHRLD